MLGRLEQHPFEVQAVGRLNLGALGDRDPGGAEPFRELVAHPLELAEIEQAGIAAGLGCGAGKPAQREGGHEGVRQLALELRDLSAKRAPRRQLVALDDRRFQAQNRGRLHRIHLPLEEIHGSLPK